MEVKINKRKETVTVTMNSDDIFYIRAALAEWSHKQHREGCTILSDAAWKLREDLQEGFEYLYRNV